ncbi:MAG: Crp/Fnr family transcriptional regulator [Bacillota bacterium]|nr:Crp/Fnr family transcriptional regulator [Bacillota bacterium]
MENINLLNIPLFEGVSKEDYEKMYFCFSAYNKSFDIHDIICNYGESNNLVGIILEGKASVIRIDINGNQTILESLNPTDMFGERLSFSGANGDSIFVIAKKACTILFIDYYHITKRCSNACLHHSMLVENLFKIMAKKSLKLSERIEVLSHRTIRDKLLCYFSICAVETHNRKFRLPSSLTALSEYLCVDRSAMMREIKNLKDEGLLEINKGIVSLPENN